MHVWKELPCIPLDSCGIGYTPLSDGAPSHLYAHYGNKKYIKLNHYNLVLRIYHQKEKEEKKLMETY